MKRLSSKRYLVSWLILAVFCLSLGSNLYCAAQIVEDAWYEVFLRGEKQGFLHRKVTQVVQGEKTVRLIELAAELEAKVLFNTGFSLVSEEKAAIDDAGIYQYRGSFEYGPVVITIDGRREGEAFRITEKQANKPERIFKVGLDKFQLSSMERPEGKLKTRGQQRPFSVLNFYFLNITEDVLKWDKDRDLKIDGMKRKCKVVKFWSHGVSGKRYYALDGTGPLLREEGKTPTGKYYMRLCSEEEAKNYSKANPYQ
jgi:hypothetical protein